MGLTKFNIKLKDEKRERTIIKNHSNVNGFSVLAIHDKQIVRQYLAKENAADFIYHCNNLESPYWEATQWFGWFDGQTVLALAMLIMKYETPVLLACSYRDDDAAQQQLLQALQPYLPRSLYCHLNRGVWHELRNDFSVQAVCGYHNMQLTGSSAVPSPSGVDRVRRLGPADFDRIVELLEQSHPDHLLDEEFLRAGYFWGIESDQRLVCLAGVVAKSAAYGLVSLGNVTTHPDYRRQGLARLTLTKALADLRAEFSTIVLNVKAQNQAAIACYRQLGFATSGSFEEVILGE